MTPADQYRVRAAELSAKARDETNPALKAEFEALALGYIRLAEQAERNARNDIVYEPPPERPDAQQQQQQQPQPKKDPKP